MPIIPSDSKTQDHLRSNDTLNSQGQNQKASAADHILKGPQIPDNMPPKASREEIEARMKELNK